MISSGEAAASTHSVTLDESLSFRMGWGHHVLVCFFLVYRISQVDHLTLSRSLRDAPLRPDSSLGELTAAVLRIFSGAGGMKSGEQASAVVLSLRGGLASSFVWESSGECGVASGACLVAWIAWARFSKTSTCCCFFFLPLFLYGFAEVEDSLPGIGCDLSCTKDEGSLPGIGIDSSSSEIKGSLPETGYAVSLTSRFVSFKTASAWRNPSWKLSKKPAWNPLIWLVY